MTTVDESAAGRLAGSAGLMLARKIAGSALGAVSSVVVVRSLAPDEFGRYAAGLAAYHLLVALTDFGFGEVLGRALGRGRVDPARFGRLVLVVHSAWACAVAVAGVVVAVLFAVGSIRGGTLLVLTPAIALAGTSALRQFFYARHQVGTLAALDLGNAVLSTVVIIGLAVLGAPPVLLAAAASAAAVITSLLLLRLSWRWLTPDRPAPEPARRSAVTGLLREAFPIGFASFLATAYVSIDVVLLSSVLDAEAVGRYAAAVKVLSILTILPGVVMSIALPQLSADFGAPERLATLLTRVWHWFMSLVMPGLAIVAANATAVMSLLFGADYAAAGSYLRILTAAGAVAMLSQLLGVVLVAAARTRWLVAQNILALAVNVGGNLLLAPRYGVVAAAWLTVVTEVIVCAGSWWLLRDRIPHLALGRVSLLPVAAVAVAVPAGWLFATWPWLALSVSGVGYVLVLSALRGWPVELVRMLPLTRSK